MLPRCGTNFGAVLSVYIPGIVNYLDVYNSNKRPIIKIGTKEFDECLPPIII